MIQELVKSISIIFYEALCCKMFWGVFLKPKRDSKGSSFLSLIILTAGFLFVALGSHYMQQEYIMRCLTIVLFVFVTSMFFYQGKWLMKLFISAIFYGIMVCVDYCSIFFMEFILTKNALENDTVQVMLVLLCKSVFFLLILLLDFVWKKHDDIQYMKNSEWLLVLSFPVLTIMVIIIMLLSFQEKGRSVGFLVVAVGLGIMNFIVFFLLKYISLREQKLHQIQLLQERNRERMQAYQEISTHYQEQKKIIHDYNNQIFCVQGLLNEKKYKEAEDYLSKFSCALQNTVGIVDVNHPVLNVVLNQKYRQAKEKGISILFLLNDLSMIWLEEQDIVILLSNLLDNAIEGCEKVKKKKVIRFKLVLEKQQIVLSVQNPLAEKLTILDGNKIKTSKKDAENHGIGLQNVQMVLDKYQGIGGIRCEDNWFYYTAIIPKMA